MRCVIFQRTCYVIIVQIPTYPALGGAVSIMQGKKVETRFWLFFSRSLYCHDLDFDLAVDDDRLAGCLAMGWRWIVRAENSANTKAATSRQRQSIMQELGKQLPSLPTVPEAHDKTHLQPPSNSCRMTSLATKPPTLFLSIHRRSTKTPPRPPRPPRPVRHFYIYSSPF